VSAGVNVAAILRALRRHAVTIALCLLALVGASLLLFPDRGAVTTDEREARKKNLLEAFRVEEISEIALTRGDKTARLVRGAETPAGQRPWEVLEGASRYPAEEQVVDQLLGALDLAVALRRVPAGSVDRAAFGLEAPRLTIAIAMGKERYQVTLGGPAVAPEGGIYAEVSGRGVVVIARELATALDAPVDSLRLRALVPLGPEAIAAIALDGEGGPRHLVRAAGGEGRGADVHRGGGFRFDGTTKDGTVRASAEAMERLMEALASLEAEAFLDPAEARRATPPRLTVTITPRAAGPGRLAVALYDGCPGHAEAALAIVSAGDRSGGAPGLTPTAACVPASALLALTMGTDALVDRRLFGAHTDEVTEVKLTSPETTVELARKGPQWHLRAPEDRNLDAETGRVFVDGLLAVTGESIVEAPDRKALGLDAPRVTLRLISVTPASDADGGDGDGDDERIETLAVGSERGGLLAVERQEDGAVLLVPRHRAGALFPSAASLRTLTIFDEQATEIRALRIEGAGRSQRLERQADGSFRLLAPRGAGLAADNGLAENLANALASLTAVMFVPEDADPPPEGPARAEAKAALGLDPPRLVIEAELAKDAKDAKDAKGEDAGAPRRLKVTLGARGSSGAFARAGDDPVVFIAPPALEEAADRFFLDRSALALDPASIRRATLMGAGASKLVVDQVDGIFRLTDAPTGAASTAKASAIRGALADLEAEGAVSLGAPERAQGLDTPRLTVTLEVGEAAATTASPGGRADTPIRLRFGAGDAFRGTSVVYVRRDGIDATYAVAQSRVRPLFEAAGVSLGP
jgi:Domain of unknown function (DUF4340)